MAEILFTKQNQIKATEFIEHTEDSILLQKAGKVYAKEFIEDSGLQFNKDYSIKTGEFVEV